MTLYQPITDYTFPIRLSSSCHGRYWQKSVLLLVTYSATQWHLMYYHLQIRNAVALWYYYRLLGLVTAVQFVFSYSSWPMYSLIHTTQSVVLLTLYKPSSANELMMTTYTASTFFSFLPTVECWTSKNNSTSLHSSKCNRTH